VRRWNLVQEVIGAKTGAPRCGRAALVSKSEFFGGGRILFVDTNLQWMTRLQPIQELSLRFVLRNCRSGGHYFFFGAAFFTLSMNFAARFAMRGLLLGLTERMPESSVVESHVINLK